MISGNTFEEKKSEVLRLLGGAAAPLDKFPGCVKVLDGSSDKTWLDEWKLRIGESKANQIINESHKIGSDLDEALELTYNNPGLEKPNLKSYHPEAKRLYGQLYPHVKTLFPIVTQPKLWSNNLKVRGYADLIAIDVASGELIMVDIKNSRRPKDSESLQDYFLQTTLYSMMFFEMTSLPIKRVKLMIGVRSENVPQIEERKTSEFVKEALSRVRIYHSKHNSSS